MKVCFVSHSSDRGGAGTMLLRLLDGLRLRGVECSVLLPREGPLREEVAARQLPFAVLPYAWWAHRRQGLRERIRDFAALRGLGRIVSQLRRWDVDLIVTNTCVVPFGALAALALKRPHVWYVHEFGQADHGLSFYLGFALTCKLMARLSTLIIVNSKAVAELYSRYIPRARIRVIYCGVDLPPRSGIQTPLANNSRPSRLVLVGSYQPGKGQMVAIRALKHLIDQQVRAELVLVGAIGDVPYWDELKRTALECHLEREVFFEPYNDDPGAIMTEGDVILMCSRSEAFGLVTVEGMKLGKPVVGARSGATPELIKEGFNGLLYAPDDPADLAAKVRYLLENPAIAKRMGDNGRRWAEDTFSVGKYIDAMLYVFNDVLGRGNGPQVLDEEPGAESSPRSRSYSSAG